MVNAQGRQRVHDGIADRRGRAIAAGLADPFDPERMERIWRHRLPQDERRHMVGTRYRVIQQGARERLALIAVAHLFVEGFAESLGHSAVYLPCDNPWVEHHATVVHQHQRVELELSCLMINAYQRHMRPKAPGFAPGREEEVSCKP